MAISGAPTTITDANGRLISVGEGRSVIGKVLSVNSVTGAVVLELTDAYSTVEAQRTQITVQSYNCRGGVASDGSF